jgi:hypothetical protein
MSEERKTAHTTLIEALEHVEEMDDVLVLWSDKEGKIKGVHNEVTCADAVFMMEVFRFVLLSVGLGGD